MNTKDIRKPSGNINNMQPSKAARMGSSSPIASGSSKNNGKTIGTPAEKKGWKPISQRDKDYLAANIAKGLTTIEFRTRVKTQRIDYNKSSRKRKTISNEASATKKNTVNAQKAEIPALAEESEADQDLARAEIKAEPAFELKETRRGFPYLAEESDDDLHRSDLAAKIATKAKRATKRSKTAIDTPSEKVSASTKSVKACNPKKSGRRGLVLPDPDHALPSIENDDGVALAAGSPAGDVEAGFIDHDAMDLDASDAPVVGPQLVSRADAPADYHTQRAKIIAGHTKRFLEDEKEAAMVLAAYEKQDKRAAIVYETQQCEINFRTINFECASDLRVLDKEFNVRDAGYEPIFGVSKSQKKARLEYEYSKRKPITEASAVYKHNRINTIAHYQRELLRVEKENTKKMQRFRRKRKISAADNIGKFIKQCYLDINTRCKEQLKELADRFRVKYVDYEQIFGNLQTDVEKKAQAANAAKAKKGYSMLSDSEDEGDSGQEDDAEISEDEGPAPKSIRGRKPTPHPNADKVKKRGGAFNARQELSDGKAEIRQGGTLVRKAKRSKPHVSEARDRRIMALDAEEDRSREEQKAGQLSGASTVVGQDDGLEFQAPDLSRSAVRQKTPSPATLGDDDIELPVRGSKKRSREPSPDPNPAKRKRLTPAEEAAMTKDAYQKAVDLAQRAAREEKEQAFKRKIDALETIAKSLKPHADRGKLRRKRLIEKEGRRAHPRLLMRNKLENEYADAKEALTALKEGWRNADELVTNVLDAHAAKGTGGAGK